MQQTRRSPRSVRWRSSDPAAQENRLFASLLARFAGIEGRAIRVRFQPVLTQSRGKLLSMAGRGQPVHAGSFIRKREMILEAELRGDRQELARIFVHELFHFVWARLGNPRRRSFEELLRVEIAAGARGELGWSAERMKSRSKGARAAAPWRVYIAESFCDTAAFLYAGCRRHEEFTLAARWRRKRVEWFRKSFAGQVLSI